MKFVDPFDLRAVYPRNEWWKAAYVGIVWGMMFLAAVSGGTLLLQSVF